MNPGKIYMIPIPIASDAIETSIPVGVMNTTKELRYFIVENIKTARRYLRQIDRSFPIDDSRFIELNKRTNFTDIQSFIQYTSNGNDIGVMSEAGCPGVADPGALVVKIAQQKDIQVVPLVGPSSILLALMGSGFDGQKFSFHGYVPFDKNELKKFIQVIGNKVKNGTQIFMDTPYRNQKLFEACLQFMPDHQLLCIAVDITGNKEFIKTKTIKEWKGSNFAFKDKMPALFLAGS